MIVLPAINCSDEECFFSRLDTLDAFSPTPPVVHLDISEKSFVKNETYWDRSLLLEHRMFDYDIHLMKRVSSEKDVSLWLEDDLFSHLYMHPRAVDDVGVWDHQKSVPVFDIHDSQETIHSFFSSHVASHILLLAVSPGGSGQAFDENIISHITTLREVVPHGILTVDGGINERVSSLLRSHGIDRVVSSSYIWNQDDPVSAYRRLLAL